MSSDTDLAFRATLDGSGFASGMQGINGHLNDLGFRTNAATAGLGSLGTVLGTLANPMTIAAAAAMALGTALAASVQAAAAWQTSMAGVAKTTGLAGEDLNKLSKELLDMSTRMPAAASEIANVAQAAGSLGIAKDDIAEFTEVAIKMGVGFEMAADQAATSGAKILTAFGMETTAANLERLGNVVNRMGDDFAATEEQVLDFTNRASYLNTTFGLGVEEVAAWGTALISVGVDANRASTGIRSLMNMSLDPKKFTAFAEAAGMSVEELRTRLNEDVAGTYEYVAEQMAGATDSVEKFSEVSKIAGTEGMEVFLKMGSAAYQGKETLAKANAEWENGSSLAKTYAAQQETFNAQMQIFWNTLNMAAIELGTVFLPSLTSGVEMTSDFVKGLIETGEAIYDVIVAWDAWVNAGVGQQAEIEKKYEEEHGGHWELIAGDAIWIQDAAAEAADTFAETFNEEVDVISTAPANALSSAEARAAVMAAGKDAGEVFGSQFAAQAALSGLSDESLLAMINSQSSPTKERMEREFEYLDTQYRLSILEGGSGYYTSLYAGDTFLGKKDFLGDYAKVDPVAAFQEITGYPAPEEGTAAYYDLLGDSLAAEKVRLKEALSMEDVFRWDDEAMKSALASQIFDAGEFIKTQMAEIGKNASEALSDGMLTGAEKDSLLGLKPSLEFMKENFPEEFRAVGGDTSLALIEAIEAGDIPGALALIGKEAGEEFAQNLLGAAALVPQSLAELIADPNALKSAAVDQDRFWQGTVLPTIKDNAEDAKKAFDSGQFTTEQIYENYIAPMGQLTDYMPGWVGEINAMFKSGAIDIDDYIYILDGMTKKASDTVEKTNAQTKAVQDQAVGYDNLKKAMEDCSDCAVSEFGQWQEAQDGLFQDSYIGPGGQGYADWKNQQIAAIAETQAAMQAMGGVSVGQQYEMPEAQIKIGADTSSAETAKADLESDIIATKPDMTLGIETQAAMDEVNDLVTYITTANPTMSVQVSVSAYAGEIQAIVADAIRSALA